MVLSGSQWFAGVLRALALGGKVGTYGKMHPSRRSPRLQGMMNSKVKAEYKMYLYIYLHLQNPHPFVILIQSTKHWVVIHG